ncbi:hypothetical protein RFI_26816 [Reticulomyxa filosa]|uniref:Flavin-nucleotide-binding protein n=1 Tax=Reticulomyxa filosa TaxID=46433 RepID=X6MA66_RETFI|nr:hypothetical protein RFI_26816 [Reticulomyxa filosa]|eukprot:ETO10561.1 hypothetical protein RFI_26816 [Reticulomyxa filosa]
MSEDINEKTEEESFEKNELTKLRRLPSRGLFERKQVYEIIDAARYCHVGYLLPPHDTLREEREGREKIVDMKYEFEPHVMPLTFGRVKDVLYLKCDKQRLQYGIPLCMTFDILDGLVLAKSAFHHSMNYRSVVAFGIGEVIDKNPSSRLKALQAIHDHQLPLSGSTSVIEDIDGDVQLIKVKLQHASGKVLDLDLPIWSGIVDCHYTLGRPIFSNQNQIHNHNETSLTQFVTQNNEVVHLRMKGLKPNNNMPSVHWTFFCWFVVFLILFAGVYQFFPI